MFTHLLETALTTVDGGAGGGSGAGAGAGAGIGADAVGSGKKGGEEEHPQNDGGVYGRDGPSFWTSQDGFSRAFGASICKTNNGRFGKD